MALFAERGLAGTRVEDIADAAGVSKGTLYLYFPCKEDLFKEAVRAEVVQTLQGLTAAADPGGPLQRLDRFLDAFWLHLRRPAFGRLYRLVLSELQQFPELARFYAEEVSGRITELPAAIIGEGVARGVFRDVEPRVEARMVVGILVQHAVWTSHRELFPHLGRRSDETLLNEIKAFLFRALLPSPADLEGRAP